MFILCCLVCLIVSSLAQDPPIRFLGSGEEVPSYIFPGADLSTIYKFGCNWCIKIGNEPFSCTPQACLVGDDPEPYQEPH
jgi:hypothetical protein